MPTQLLKKAFDRASQMPDAEQNILAQFIVEEIEAENQWDQRFKNSQDLLAELANDALNDSEKDKAPIMNP